MHHLQLATPFSGTCFGHVVFKECQYATNDIKIGVEIFAKHFDLLLHSLLLTWTKKSGKGTQEWESTCKETS